MPTSPNKLAAIASSDRVKASQLVRFCLVAANGLGDQRMTEWCREELNGCGIEQIEAGHPYRMVYAKLEAIDHWGRRLPAYVEDPEEAKVFSHAPMLQPIGEIESLVANARPKGHFQVSFLPEAASQLREAFQGALEVYRVVQTVNLLNVLNGVRQRVFEWTLELTERGTSLPDDVPFNEFFGDQPEPMVGVVKGGVSTVVNISGASHSPIQIAGSHSQQSATVSGIDPGAAKELVAALLAVIKQHEKGASEMVKALRTELENLQALLAAPKPKQEWVRDGLTTVRSFLESAAGSALYEAAKATGLVAGIGKLLGM